MDAPGKDKNNSPLPPAKKKTPTIQKVLIESLQGLGRGFAIGYAVRCALSFFSAVFGRKLYRKPRKLVEASFLHKDTIGFALFLALYCGGFRCINGLLHHYRQKDDGLNAAISGAISGISILFFRSNEIAMYALVRAMEVVYYTLHNKGILPSYKHGDSVIFALSTAVVGYCLFLEPYAIKPAYQRFLAKATGQLDFKHLREKYGSQTMPYL